jgi:putative radical SAM enzyme (TIGR03279 family)
VGQAKKVPKGALVFQIQPGSLADKIGLQPQDIILSINGNEVRDLIDYQYLMAEEKIKLDVLHPDGYQESLLIIKEEDEDLGIRFEAAVFDGIRHCQNRCCFCFVDQLPSGLRSSLYLKDDDYRLSFLHGNFVTLNNLREDDLERILKWHLSPLYVSVHTTDPELRPRLMGNRHAGRIMEHLKRLSAGGITIHAQIVLCPGLNDRAYLQQTILDLARLGPNIASVGVVPVGLTRYRENLTNLRSFTAEEARDCIELIQQLQLKFKRQRGERFVFLSDEFYLLAGVNFPAREFYEDFPQLENGVGLSRLFLDEFNKLAAQLPKNLDHAQEVLVITGQLGYLVLKQVLPAFEEIDRLKVKLHTVDNLFFGPAITVTGLLTGQDIYHSLTKSLTNRPDRVIVSEVMLKTGTTLFLDDWTVNDLEERLGVSVQVASNNAQGLIEAVINRKLTRRPRRRSLRSRFK